MITSGRHGSSGGTKALQDGRHGAPGVPPVARTSTPQGAQAQAVAEQEFRLLTAGDWQGAWNLWTGIAKQDFSQAAFVQLNQQCQPQGEGPYTILRAARISPATVRVGWRRGPESGTNNMILEHGAWRFSPSLAQLEEYHLGVTKLVARLRAENACG